MNHDLDKTISKYKVTVILFIFETNIPICLTLSGFVFESKGVNTISVDRG
mgnify:CR=1 FL=1